MRFKPPPPAPRPTPAPRLLAGAWAAIWQAVGSVLDLGGVNGPDPTPAADPAQADAAKLAGDWETIGEDLAQAMDRTEPRGSVSQKRRTRPRRRHNPPSA